MMILSKLYIFAYEVSLQYSNIRKFNGSNHLAQYFFLSEDCEGEAKEDTYC